MNLYDSDSSGDDPYDFAKQYRMLKQKSKKKLVENNSQKSKQIDPVIDPIDPIDLVIDSFDCANSNENTDACIPSTSKGPRQTRNKNKKCNRNIDSVNVLGPVICIGDFCDGYDMPPPKQFPKKIINIEDDAVDEIDEIIEKKKKKRENADEEAYWLTQLTHEMSVKVYWQERRTYRFPIRKFQSIESIYEFFANLENIKQSEVSLTLNKKLLAPTDTPYAMNYKITDFIDGDIVFYKSPYEKTDITRLEKPEDEVDFKIIQKNVKMPLYMGLKKDDKMIVLYVKLSEKLGLDLSSFILEFDGDIIDKLDTMESLDIEGGECFELYQK